MYPQQISPIKGVTDEHFIVWMRTAGLPTFRKLYGRLNYNIKAGATLRFKITANYQVGSFSGQKALVISTVGQFGGKNPFLGIAYVVVGAISLLLGFLFGLKHYFNPRKFADTSKLHWT